MKHYCNPVNLTLAFLVLSAFTNIVNDETGIAGIWIRKSDNLRIEVKAQDPNNFYSIINAEGDEKFPCEISGLPIYKNITRTGKNLWQCDFLVVTMGSCRTEYEEGQIRLKKYDELEVICPGFSKKIYSRVKPRFDPTP